MSCREWRLVWSANFALHAELAKLWRHNLWSNLRAPLNNDACVNNFPLFQARRHNGSVEAWQQCTHVCRSQRQQRAMKVCYFDTAILWITRLSFYWQGKRVPTHDAFRKKETSEFDMSYSKTKWGYSLRAAMKMKTSPQFFQWILLGTVPDSRWGDI